MIASGAKKNFFEAHWDWLAAGAGLAALAAAGAALFMSLSVDADSTVAEVQADIKRAKRNGTGVEAVDMKPYSMALAVLDTPPKLADVSAEQGSFMGSEKRMFCEQGEDPEHKSCGAPMPADVKVCPFCQTKQPEEKKVVRDSDGDGIPDEWEQENGMNPNDAADASADADGDGFTNVEEYEAGTDFKDPKSHPDYLDSLKLVLPLKATTLPFYFEKATEIPSGYRYFFKDPKQKNDYGKLGRVYSVLKDEEIGKTGFVVKSYEKKSKTSSIKGGTGMTKVVDVSVAEIARKSDGKRVRLVIGERHVAVDVQATLLYERGDGQPLTVVPGQEFSLNMGKYKVESLEAMQPKGAKIVIKDLESGKLKTLEALEQ